MNGYQATARIGRVAPRVLFGTASDADAGGPVPRELVGSGLEVAPVLDDDPFVAQLIAIRDRWDQLTFYLFDPESWR